MTESRVASDDTRRTELTALAEALRPELHRYCARLMGSVVDGEEVVQDALTKAVVAFDDLGGRLGLRAWLFRVAHNRAVDLLRGRSIRAAEPLEAADNIADETEPDPEQILMGHEAIELAVTRFTALPVLQRSVIILKDVLDEPLADIATLLGITVDAVKAHLARGRTRLRMMNAGPTQPLVARPTSAAVARYVALFRQRDWDGLRALLADDVKLQQSTHPLRVGAADVGLFFSIYATIDGVDLVPARLEGREAIAVFEDRSDPKPGYFMVLEWQAGKITFIRDYRYVRYVIADAELTLAPDAARWVDPRSEGLRVSQS